MSRAFEVLRRERQQLAQAIADAACKLGITSEGVALTGPHLLMLLGDMVGVVEAAGQQGEPVMRLEAEKLIGGDGEYAVDFVKPGWLDECRRTGGTFFLYTKPPMVKVDDSQARLTEATAFVQRMCDVAGKQPSVATGYLRDILDVLKARPKLNGRPG